MASIPAMINNFRDHHPMGSILTELLRIEEGIHFVRAQIIVNSTVLGTGLAGSNTVEEAEDAALKRALTHAGFSQSSLSPTHAAVASPPWQSPSFPSYEDPLPVSKPETGSPALSIPTSRVGNGHLPPQPAQWEVPIPAAPPPIPPSAAMGSPFADPMDDEDLSDVIAQTDVEMKRVGWTSSEGRDYLLKAFGKKSRQLLEPRELLQFLQHLQQQPTRSPS
ncbi:MAG: hypothetical protein ACFCU9_08705 [Cyanophyceae cyanobacterium]